MLDISQIASYYPENVRPFKKNLLREYVQHRILEVIYTSPYANGLYFMGGTAIRIVHGGTRFSEDLDFDNRSLDAEGFQRLSVLIEKRLNLEGYSIETRNTLKTAFRSSIRFKELLYQTGISRHRDERLTIQIDMEPQNFTYVPASIIINKFELFTRAHVVPVDILLAQKISCIFTRKRPMGRDFFDIIFLMGKTRPNLDYIREKLGIGSGEALKKDILLKCNNLDFRSLSKDISAYLTNPSDKNRILSFSEYVGSAEF